jgi:hypothetical protein
VSFDHLVRVNERVFVDFDIFQVALNNDDVGPVILHGSRVFKIICVAAQSHHREQIKLQVVQRDAYHKERRLSFNHDSVRESGCRMNLDREPVQSVADPVGWLTGVDVAHDGRALRGKQENLNVLQLRRRNEREVADNLDAVD